MVDNIFEEGCQLIKILTVWRRFIVENVMKQAANYLHFLRPKVYKTKNIGIIAPRKHVKTVYFWKYFEQGCHLLKKLNLEILMLQRTF